MAISSLEVLPAATKAVEASLTQAITQQFAELRAMIEDLAQSTTAKYQALEQRIEALEQLPVLATTIIDMPITPPAPPPLGDKEMMKVVVPDGSSIPKATATIPQLGRQPLEVGFPLVSHRGNHINSDPDRQLDDNFGDEQGTDF
ncbi:unnamed protein product [Linum trigynum]|uniref:Uncharacterized protein n=1 Tax=Linum trigynum TaxID=586398 RepID=A0AAV2G8U6_9ROSI